jgi:hypothetical protein
LINGGTTRTIKWFNNTDLADSGYRLQIDPDLLGPGLKRIDMIGRTKRNGKLHRFKQPLYLIAR